MAWNPAKYLTFGQARLRPALDLLAQARAVAPATAARVVDLGCGPGNLTKFLRDAWPAAHIESVDSSPEMLAAGEAAAAKEGITNVSWHQAGIEEFESKEPADVIFSNAALHWVPNHRSLLPQLMKQLKPGGVFAMQIPDTRRQASHLLMETAAANLGIDISAVRIPRCEEDPGFYVDVLGSLTAGGDLGVNTWSTEYCQMLTGDNPVAAYTRTTGLQPLLQAAGERAAEFEAEYKRLIEETYPPLPSGVTVFPFKRFFLVAQKHKLRGAAAGAGAGTAEERGTAAAGAAGN